MIAKAKPIPSTCYPDDCLQAPVATERWWVARTKSRCEKTVSAELQKLRIAHYLPLVDRVTGGRDRIRRSRVPLFQGYIFIRATEAGRLQAFQTRRIAQTLEVTDESALLAELLQIKSALAWGGTLALFQQWPEGQRCRIIAGPLLGTEGVVVRHQGETRLVLQVSMLGIGASLEIETELLEPIDSTR